MISANEWLILIEEAYEEGLWNELSHMIDSSKVFGSKPIQWEESKTYKKMIELDKKPRNIGLGPK